MASTDSERWRPPRHGCGKAWTGSERPRWVILESAWPRPLLNRGERGMPQERLPMRKIREVLRLKADGFSKRRIAASLGISATAAMECVQRARRAGLTWPLPENLSDEALERRLYPPTTINDEQRPLPNWAEIHRELKRPGVTLQLLWQEYREQHPNGYGYS